MANILDRFKDAWDVFRGAEKYPHIPSGYSGFSYPPSQRRSISGFKDAVNSIFNRIAVDVASIPIYHIKTKDGRFVEVKDSYLNYALTKSANMDQTGRQLIQDIVESMCQEGVVAVVPTHSVNNPETNEISDIGKIRVGKIVDWYPQQVKVELYNEMLGRKETIVVSKKICCIIENPFYTIMNAPNSRVKRVQRLLRLMDNANEQAGSNKLDLIIQLPYQAKTPLKKAQNEKRKKEIEGQLVNSPYGIAYIDGTEHIIQLNRPIENTFGAQIKEQTTALYNEFGLTESVFNGTASESEQLNYFNRSIEPILSAIVNEMSRKWIPYKKRNSEDIRFYRDPFRLAQINSIAEMADKFTRNEIMSSNEIRAVLGLKPSDDPKADRLINSNLNHPIEESYSEEYGEGGDENDTYDFLR